MVENRTLAGPDNLGAVMIHPKPFAPRLMSQFGRDGYALLMALTKDETAAHSFRQFFMMNRVSMNIGYFSAPPSTGMFTQG